MLTLLNILRWKVSFRIWQGILLTIAFGMIALYFSIKPSHSYTGSVAASLTPSKATTYTDVKSGKEHSIITGNVYTEDQVKAIKDSIFKANPHLSGKVVSLNKTIIVTKDTVFVPQTFYMDTIDHVISAVYEDSFIRMEFLGNTVSKYGKFSLDIVPDSAFYVTTVKKRLFKSDLYQMDISHSNNYFQTVSGSSITIKPVKPLLVFGPVIGVGVDFKSLKPEPFLGVGMTLNIFSIKQKD